MGDRPPGNEPGRTEADVPSVAPNPLFTFLLSLVLVVGGGFFVALSPHTDQMTTGAIVAAVGAVVYYWFGRKPPTAP